MQIYEDEFERLFSFKLKPGEIVKVNFKKLKKEKNDKKRKICTQRSNP